MPNWHDLCSRAAAKPESPVVLRFNSEEAAEANRRNFYAWRKKMMNARRGVDPFPQLTMNRKQSVLAIADPGYLRTIPEWGGKDEQFTIEQGGEPLDPATGSSIAPAISQGEAAVSEPEPDDMDFLRQIEADVLGKKASQGDQS